MLANILWGLILVFLVILVLWRKNKKDNKPFREETEQEKETEKQIAIEKERSRRGYPWI